MGKLDRNKKTKKFKLLSAAKQILTNTTRRVLIQPPRSANDD